MKPFRYEVIPNFLENPSSMRLHFDKIMSNPWSENRFQWDYFFIQNQYRLIRTWADQFFTKNDWANLESALTEFGQKYLGCQGITRPWISFYTDGCYQNIHADVPHGPFAFVYSLTDWKNRKFKGGETILFKDTALDYWNQYEKLNGVESKDLFDKIPSKMNQLLIFDPRIPHGVERVSGVESPLESRLVIHGWFAKPEPTMQGPFASKDLARSIEQFINSQADFFRSYKELTGYLCVRIEFDSLKTTSTLMINTVRGLSKKDTKKFLDELSKNICNYNWIPKTISKNVKTSTNKKTIVTLPLMFQSH